MLRKVVSRVRPAPVQAAVARALRLDRPRVVCVDGLRLLVNPASVEGGVIEQGTYEPLMTATLRHYLRPGSCFVDLGAHVGYFSLIASRLVGSEGSVVAVEPQSRLQAVLQQNVQENECFNVRLVRAIVAAKAGTERLHLASSLNTGSSSLFRGTRYWQPTETIRSLTLADLLAKCGLRNVDLMKVDIEGAEYDVLMQAEDVLRAGLIRVLAVDIHESVLARRGLSPERLRSRLEDYGYRLNQETAAYEFGAS